MSDARAKISKKKIGEKAATTPHKTGFSHAFSVRTVKENAKTKPADTRADKPKEQSVHNSYVPQTRLGQDLLAIRNKAIAQGMELRTKAEIDLKVEEIRGAL